MNTTDHTVILRTTRAHRTRHSGATLRRRILGAGIAAALALLVPGAGAADFTWNGGAGNWNDTAKWTPTGFPNSTSDTATMATVLFIGFGVDLTGGPFTVNQLSFTGHQQGGFSLHTGTLILDGAGATVSMEAFDSLGASKTLDATGTFQLNATTSFNTVFADSVLTAQGTISGAGGLVKDGAGALVLSNAGANTYTGGTQIDDGRISVTKDSHLGTGKITFYGGELLVDGMTFSTAKSIEIFDGAAGRLSNSYAGGPANFAGVLTLNVGSTLAVGSAGNTGIVTLTPTAGSSTTAASNVTVDFGVLRNGNAMGFTFITGAGGVTTVAGNGALDAFGFATGIANLQGSGLLTNYGSGPATYTITSGDFSGAINDGGGSATVALVKTGASTDTLRLTGTSNYSGGTTIAGGTLEIGSDASLGAAGGGVTFTATPDDGVLRTLAGITSGRTMTLTQTGIFDSNGFDSTWNGQITGPKGLIKTGAGTLTLTNDANNYTVVTGFGGGTLAVSAEARLGGGNLQFNGGTLRALSTFGSAKNVSLLAWTDAGGDGTGHGTIQVDPTFTLTLSGNVTGPGSLTKTGAGTLALTNGANSYTGGTNLNAGTVSFANGALGSAGTVAFTGNSTLQWNGANTQDISARLKIEDGITATIDTNGNAVTFATALQTGALKTGGLTKIGVGTLAVIAANTYTGATTVHTGALFINNDGTTTFGALGGGPLITNGGTTPSGFGGSTFFLGNASAGSAMVTTNGGTNAGAHGGSITFGTSTTAGTASFTTNGGTDTGALGGSIFIGGTAANGTFITNGTGVSGAFGGLIQFLDSATAANGNFTTNGGTGSGTLGGAIYFNSFSTAGNGIFTINGGTAQDAAGGTMEFSFLATAGAATFIVNGGINGGLGGSLAFKNESTGGTATVQLSGNGKLDISQHQPPGLTLGSIAGSGDVILGYNNLTVGGNNASTFFFGVIQDGSGIGGSLTKTGTGTFTLTNANTYTGATTVNDGTLAVDSFGVPGFAKLGSGPVTILGSASGGGPSGTLQFRNDSTAGAGTFTNLGGTGSGGIGGRTEFLDGSDAGNATFANNGGTASGASGGNTIFNDDSRAGLFTVVVNEGGAADGAFGGNTIFKNVAGARNATITANGTAFSNAGGGFTIFDDRSHADAAILIANGGTNGGGGGTIRFLADSTGDFSTVKVFGNGRLDISLHNAPGVSIGSLEGDGNVFLGANNLTVGGNNASTTFSGVLQAGGASGGTGGSFTKVGTGTLILTNGNFYSGDTNINGGSLLVNGYLAGNNVFVNPGGTLGGTGNVLGHVVNFGTVSPGNSPGTLSIYGNYTQAGNGTLRIELASKEVFDRLAVNGRITLGGTVALVPQNGFVLALGDKLVLATAAGGVAGGSANGTALPASSVTGGAALSSSALLVATVKLYPTTVVLELMQGSFAALSSTLSLTPNQLAVAKALDSVVTGIGSKTGVFGEITFLDTQPLSTLAGNLDKISPDELTAMFNIAVSLANIQTTHIQGRTAAIRDEAGNSGGPGPALDGIVVGGGPHGPVGKRGKEIRLADSERWGMWFTGAGEFTHVGSTTNAAGFNTETGGVTAGVDYRFTDHFAAGISLGYMNTNASLVNGGKVDVDGGRVGLYATYFDRGFYVDAAVSGGFNSYDTRRITPNTTAATGKPDGAEINTLLAAGYDWKLGGLTIGPTASFQYTNVELDGFTENGTFAPLTIAGKNAESLRTALGVRATFDAKVGGVIIRPEARAAWQHEYGDTTYSLTSSFATLGGNAFTVSGPTVGRDSLLVGAGFTILWSPRFSTYAFYDGELLRTNYSSHNVSAGFRYRF